MMKKRLLIITALFSVSVAQNIWWVDLKNGNNSNAGSTEATAFKTVHHALESNTWSSGDTIKVKPSLTSDGTLSYYDFGNDEINLNTSNDFVLMGTGGADSTIFDAEEKNRHFIFDDGQSSETIIKGITFKNGYADNWPGAGSINLTNNTNIQFIDCTWENNSTNGQEGGGAIIIREGATPSFTGCTFEGNYVNNPDGGNNGGAVNIQWPNSKVDLENTIYFKKTKFINNYLKVKHSAYGGAVYSARNVDFENCLFVNNRAIANNGGTGNEAWGGAILFEASYWNGSSYDGGVMKIVNSTFHGNYIQTLSSNYGDMRGGTINYGRWSDNANSKTYIFNTIVSGSKVLIEQTERVTTGSDYLKNEVIGAGNTNGYKLTLDYSNVQGSTGMSWSGDYTYEVVPVYKDTANGDYSLSDKSPLIGAGVATWSDEGLSAPTEDILGNARPNPSGSNPDMGAYENSNSASTAPLPVSGLTVTRATEGASLSWGVVKESLSSSTNASNIEYQIYQDGTNVAQTTSTSYSVTGLSNGTTYSFTVSAKNTSTGVEGAQSGAKTVTPRYQGPKWYVAASDGKSLSDTTTNYDLGSSSSPINHLSNGIEIAAAGDTIVMMKGTHTGSNNRGINENGNKSFIIMGDPDYSADQIIIDAGGRDRHFTFDNNEDTTFQIIGLTLYNGKTTSRGGGSIEINSAAVKLKNVIFKENYSTGENWSTSGAVFISNNGKTIIDGCTFDGNYIYGDDSGHVGGAIFAENLNKSTDTLKIKNSIFKNNYVKAKHEARGGAIAIYHYQAVVENNLFYDNYVYSSLGNTNQQNASGGAVYLYNPNYWDNNTQSSKSLLVLFRNNTVVNNWVTSEKSDSYIDGAGVDISGWDPGVIYFFNNIIWGNKLLGETNHHQIYLNYNDEKIKFNEDYNDVQYLTQHNQYSRFGDYSVSYEPEFSDSANGDFTLSNKSLLIGAGTNNMEGYAAPAKDITGGIRPNPAGSTPDMGAYENSLAKSPYPKQVANVTAVGGSGQVTLNWDAVADADSAYKVYKHTDAFSVAATYYVGATSAKTSPHETTYTITGLDNATRYYFRVTAVSKLGYEGTASATVDITPKFSGPIWWVATDGNDNSNEGSKTSPFISLDHAMHEANEGDTIKIKPGTYTGSKNRDLDSEGKNLVIMSQYPTTWDSVIIDAEKQNLHFQFNNNSGTTVSASKTKLIGLTLKNGEVGGQTNTGGLGAGSVRMEGFASVTFEKIYFLNNTIINYNSTSSVAAVYMSSPGSKFYYCRFESNRSIHSGQGDSQSTGAIAIDGDGNYAFSGIYTLIDGCEFIKNEGRNEGGAINARHNTVIQNSLFYKNKANNQGAHGGAIAAMPRVQGDGGWAYDTYLHVINSTFVENSAAGGGGAISIYGSNGPIIFNSIFMNNKEQNHSDINDFSISGGQGGSDAQVDYTRVNPETVGNDYGNLNWGSNIYTDSPSFTDTTKEDFTLTSASTLIGSGTTSFEGVSSPTKDIQGNSRPNPSGSTPDLGAYENSLAESPFPSQVKNVTATIGSQSVNLSWDANIETDIEKYLIYMSETFGFEPTSEDSIGESATNSFSATGLTNNTEYHFRVAAVDSSGYRGAFSQEISAMPQYMGPTWWVDIYGNDMNDGSQSSPFFNLNYAFSQIANGDTIILTETGQHDINNEIGGDALSNLTEFHLRGSTGDPKDVSLSGTFNSRHFSLQNKIATFKYITFKNGVAHEGTGGGGGGSFIIGPGTETRVNFDNCIFYKNQSDGSSWGSGGAILLDNVQEAKFVNCIFRENRIEHGSGGAVYINDDQSDGGQATLHVFDNCQFIRNGIQSGALNEQKYPSGGALAIHGAAVIENSVLDSNYIRHEYANTGEKMSAWGGAIYIGVGGDGNNISSWNDIPLSIIRANQISNTEVRVTGSVDGVSLSGQTKLRIENNLIIHNRALAEVNQDGWDFRGGVLLLPHKTTIENLSPPQVFINNTVVFNKMDKPSGSNVFTPGLLIQHNNDTGENAPVVGNNIIYFNETHEQDGAQDFTEWGVAGNIVQLYNNLFDRSSDYGTDPISAEPKFKNPSSGNFQLSNNSPAIDAGAYSFPNGVNAPITDIRGYYRVGTPDIGAYEAGASKYLLAMADDIEADEDTTFVKLDQALKITVTTGDIDGNLVSSNESMSWNIFPNQKYVKFVSGDTDTEGGDASATFQVTDQDRGKGFRFRIEAGVGEAFLRSGMYVIEELVTGAPPPVSELTISPSTWTSDPNFTLNWKTPVWSEQRDLIGAVVEITDGINVYNEYMGFPSGDTLTSYSFTAPEAGEFEAFLWLIDELGNEHKDSSRSVKAYFDNVAPENFITHNPDSYQGQVFYTSDKPRFEWDDKGDYPSGIKEWQLFINDNHYGTYTRSDVNFDGGSDMGYVNGSTPLADGYYTWWVEVADSAGNTTRSDSGYFGVDLSPPSITHNSPLTVIDENSTSPAINATFSDGASGVKHGRLHYRRSGSNTGFIAADLLSGPVNIPGSDVKSTGVEYYISSEDSVGNRGQWPSDKSLHSVKVKTESAVTTSSRWSSGVPGGTDSTNYVFFSIPFDVGNAKSAITSVLDPDNEGPNEFNYRLYGYSNGWQENPSSVTMGNGYFLIYDPDKYTDNPQLQFNFGQGTTTPTDPPYSVAVSSGQWKFFGTPYNFDISLDNVYTENDENIRDAGSIYTWNGSWSNAGSSLKPWYGYIYKSGGAGQIKIDGRGQGFNKMAKAMNPDDYPMDANEWIVDMVATTGNARDELNSVGVRSFASDGYDPLDEFEPPGVPGDVVLRIDNRNRQETPDLYAKDIRKPNEEGHYWDLQVFAPTNGQRTYITFEGLGYIPDEYDVFLINKTTKQAKNLEWDAQYRFANTGSESYLKQEFRLVVGTKQFVEDNNAGVSLYPDAFTLAQNYPNPFNPQTSIMISLEEDAQVDLIIYNLLGEEITRLAHNELRPAGYYNFIWNGRNNLGDKVSTGVYFYHALFRNGQGKVVLNKTRKMILLK